MKRNIELARFFGPSAGLLDRLALAAGTSLGAGLIPGAPGTMGACVGLPIAYLTAGWPAPYRVAIWTLLTILGVWAAKVIDERMGSSDNQSIVIDETVGLGITAWTAGTHLQTLAAAFVLFRLFDILKPPPIRQVDRWSKIQAIKARVAPPGPKSPWSSCWGGFGVMADDLLAGLEGLLVVFLLQRLDILR
jgi:phosphatidylglycerophosphatase A